MGAGEDRTTRAADVLLGHRHRDRGDAAPGDGQAVAADRRDAALHHPMLGLDLPVPDHTTLSRRSARLSLTTALKKPKGPVKVVIDSSGLKIFGAGEWLHEKHGGKPRRSWRRLHLAVDPDSSDILAAELTTTDEGDASLVGPLLDQIDGPFRSAGNRHRGAKSVADTNYVPEPNSTIGTRSPQDNERHPAGGYEAEGID